MPDDRRTTEAIAVLTHGLAEYRKRQTEEKASNSEGLARIMEMMEQMRAEMRSEFRELKLQRIRAEKQPAQYPPSPSTLSSPPFTPCASLDETHTMSSPPLLLPPSEHHEILTGFGTRVHPTAIVTPMLSNSTRSLREISASVMEGFNINSTVSSNTSLDHLSFILKMNTGRNDDSQGYMNAEVPFSVFYGTIHSCLLPVCVYDSVKVSCAFVRNMSFVRIQFSTQSHYTSALWVKPPPKPPDGSFEVRRMLNLTKIIESAIGYHMIRCRGDLCLPIKLPSMEFKVLPMARVKFKRVYGTFGIWNEVLLFCYSRMGRTGFGESTELSDAIEDSKELMCSFVSHENHLLLDSRVDYSALSCVSFVAASLSLSGPIYMAIESEELISPEDTCIQRLVQRNQPEVAACDAIPEVAACGLDDPCDVEVKPIGSETSSQHLGIKYSSESNNLIKLELIVAASCEEVEKSVLVVDDQVSLLLSSDPFLIEDAPKPKHPYLILELQKEVISEYFTINYSSDLSNNEVVMEVDETPELGISFSFSNLNLNSCSPSVCKNASEDWPSYLTMLTDFHSYNLLPKLKVRCMKPPAKPPDNIDNLHVDDLSALVMILNDTCEEESSLLSFPDPWKHMRGVHKFLQVKVVDGNFVYDKGKGHNYKKKNDLKIYKHSVQDIGKLKPTVFDVFPHMLYILFGFKEVILKLAWLGKPPPLPPEICHNRSAHIGTDIIDNFGLFFPSTRADGLSIFFIFAFFASYWITFPSKIYEKNLQQHIYFESLGSERQTEYGKDAISLKFISAASYNAMVAVVVVNEGSHDSSTISQLTQWYVTQIPSCHSSSRLQQDNNALGAYLVTLMYGFHFVVYCARMLENARCISLENHVMQFDSNDQQSLLGTTEMSILLSIEMRQGSHAPSYVVKIEPLAEACDPVTFTKLDIVAGLTYLKTKKHELVASTILQPGIEWGNTYSELTAPQDVAIYGKLRALASFDSTELKNKVINNSNFKSFLEFVTGVRELKNNLHSSHYPSSLGNFGDNKSDLFLDINEHAVVYHGHTKSASILLNKSYENRGHDFGLSQLASSSCAKHLITLAPDATSHLICQLTKLHVATGDDASAQQFVYYGLRILDAHIYAYRWTANMEKFQEQFLKFSSPRPPEVADLEDKVDFKERGMLRVKEILVMWGNIKGQGGARCRGLILAEMQLRGASYNRRRTAGKEDKKGTTRRRGMASLAQE